MGGRLDRSKVVGTRQCSFGPKARVGEASDGEASTYRPRDDCAGSLNASDLSSIRRVLSQPGTSHELVPYRAGAVVTGVMKVATQRCPNCNGELPPELGQHAQAPLSGLVNCPHCGAQVKLDKPGQEGSDDASSEDVAGADEALDAGFSGSETIAGVREELEDKQQGDATP
jgi:hypothetical protein